MSNIEEKIILSNETHEQSQNDTLTFNGINIFLNKIQIPNPSDLVLGDNEIIFSEFYNNTIQDLNKIKSDNEILLGNYDSKLDVEAFNTFTVLNTEELNSKVSTIEPYIINSLTIGGSTSILNLGSGSISGLDDEINFSVGKLTRNQNELLDTENWDEFIKLPNNYVFDDRNSRVKGNIYFENGFGTVYGSNNNLKVSSDGQNSYFDLNSGNLYLRDGLVNRISIEKSNGNTTFSNDIIVKNHLYTKNLTLESTDIRPFQIIGKNSQETVFGIGNKAGGGASLILDGVNGNFTGNDYMLIGQDNDLRGRIEMISPDHVIDFRIASNNVATYTTKEIALNRRTKLTGGLVFQETELNEPSSIFRSKQKYLIMQSAESGMILKDYWGTQAFMFNREKISFTKDIEIRSRVYVGYDGGYDFNIGGGDKLLGLYNEKSQLMVDVFEETLNVYIPFNVENQSDFRHFSFFHRDVTFNNSNLVFNGDNTKQIYRDGERFGEFSWEKDTGFSISDTLFVDNDLFVSDLLVVSPEEGKITIGNSESAPELVVECLNRKWIYRYDEYLNVFHNDDLVLMMNEVEFNVLSKRLSARGIIAESIIVDGLYFDAQTINTAQNFNIVSGGEINLNGSTFSYNGETVYHSGNLPNVPNLEEENIFMGKQTFRGDILLKDFGNATFTINGTSGSYLNMYSSNGAHISHETQNLDQSTVLKKVGKNADNSEFTVYSESWFDGQNEIKITAKEGSIVVTSDGNDYDIVEMANEIDTLKQELQQLKDLVQNL